MSKVHVTDGCWYWTAGRDKDGYGKFHLQVAGQNLTMPAHRASWILFVGPIAGDLLVRHTCDTPSCVNYRHLALGTTADNVADRVTRGRSESGERHHNATVSDADCETMRAMRGGGMLLADLAALYGTTKTTVSRICRGISRAR
jgi:hypothetical protein